jgi:tRNA threonylcarbamoyladenosine biosynthesis protein TsaE
LHDADDSRSGVSRHSAAGRKLAITLSLADEAATAAFASKLARALQPGLVIWLQGDLGAGKTTLVRALLHALGHRGRVKSPSYALVELYEAAGLHLRHFDLYRFRDASEWENAGFRDEFNGCNVCLIEWPEKAQELLPQADIAIRFEILPDGRKVTLSTNTMTGRECLGKLQN